jgi:hypothetical protein
LSIDSTANKYYTGFTIERANTGTDSIFTATVYPMDATGAQKNLRPITLVGHATGGTTIYGGVADENQN